MDTLILFSFNLPHARPSHTHARTHTYRECQCVCVCARVRAGTASLSWFKLQSHRSGEVLPTGHKSRRKKNFKKNNKH